jgi:ParB-like chromosome segregation protein Spo0J
MGGPEFEALKADIAANGLRQRIVLHNDLILDGGNRYRACVEVGVKPQFKKFDGDNIVAFVLSANLHRRHMSAGQQAALVASAQDWDKTHRQGGDGSNQHGAKEQTGKIAALQTVADRAAQSGASERTQRMADKVARADPDLAKRVAQGDVSLSKAVEQITPPKPVDTGVVRNATPEQARAMSEPAPSDGMEDPVELLEQAYIDIAKLEAQLEALTQDDMPAELRKAISTRQGIEARLALEMTKSNDLDKSLRQFGKLTSDLREFLGVESNSKILSAVKALRKEAP